MRNEQEIAEIVIQLQRLQLQQSELLHRLTQVDEENNDNAAKQASPPRASRSANAPREFAIGDKVRIVNPNRFQPKKGTIIKIGDRITVLAKNGTKVYRVTKNLLLDE